MADDTDRIEQLKALFMYAEKLLAALLVLNGGAVVAIISFVGGLWGKNDGATRVAEQITRNIMGYPIWLFSVALFCTLISYLLAYLSQLDYYNGRYGNNNRFHRIAYIPVLLSIGCFTAGVVAASIAVRSSIG